MRLLVISNRLPVTVTRADGRLKFQESVGGLVTGLSAYLASLKDSAFTESEYVWVGWPGIAVEDNAQAEVKAALEELQAYPVFLPEATMENFYHGFCNKTIWPLFHSFPSYAQYHETHWAHYRQVNEAFCNAVMEIIKPGDAVWIHDYHLMLLPELIRARMPDTPVGFFFFFFFPPFEMFRLLPWKWRKEMLQGLLGSDLIGFHTFEYTEYFLRCVLRTLGGEHNLGRMLINDRIVKADTFPMGIDYRRFSGAVNEPEVRREKAELERTLAGLKVVLSIDRLDYTKGIINRLQGYESFLEKNPQWRKKVTLVMVVVPSRVGVERYQETKRQIDELVGKINGRFGSFNWTPILYQYKFLPFHPLTALYSVSDAILVTPLRDGMNLIAKEYLAVRAEQPGVLILSEMAGASNELGEAVVINPNNVEEIADALKDALSMPAEEQLQRNRVMQRRLKRYDVVRWADDFIRGLASLREEQKVLEARLLDTDEREQLLQDFGCARRRILLLDYDGTLSPLVEHPQMAAPSEELLKTLAALSKKHGARVVLISGRDKDTLQRWFGNLPIEMAGEHGAWLKERGKQSWHMLKPLDNGWKSQILPIMEMYADRLPGSFIEEKAYSIAWHYRKADAELASIRAKELMDNLVSFTASADIQVYRGHKVVEVRAAGVNKGHSSLHFTSKEKFDFILAIGDDETDEDMFKALPKTAYTIRVGMIASHARFNLRSQTEVGQLLCQLSL